MILLFPVGGVIADRLNKRNIMVALDFSTSVLVFLFSVLIGKFEIVPLIAISMIILYSIQGAYQPTVKASIPVLVDTKYLMQANSVVDIISSLANMIGPVIGGLLFSLVGLKPILFISIACFFLSAVMEMFLQIPFERKEKQRNENMLAMGLKDIKESFKFMFQYKPAIWKMCITYGSVNLLLCALFIIAMPVLLTQVLGFQKEFANQLYGYAEGVIAVGSILGGLLAGILAKKLKTTSIPYLIIGCAFSILAGGMALQFLTSSIAIYIVLVAGCSVLMVLTSLFQVQMMSYIQILTPNDLIGKVISCVICFCMCSSPIGQFLYGLVFEHIGNYTYIPFYAASLVTIVIGLLSFSIYSKIGIEIRQQIEELN
jgi:putative permease